MSEPIPYDEMRAILRLPDVRHEVRIMRALVKIRALREILANLGVAAARAWAPEPTQADYALAAPKDGQ